jgi:hypothetical protein
MEKDHSVHDIADISAFDNNDNCNLCTQSRYHRQFNCTYDLVSNKLINFGGSEKVGSGDDDGSFPRETCGRWDGSKEGIVTNLKTDDELLEFTITDTYEPVKADAGGPYTAAVDKPVAFNGGAEDGMGPYTYYWDFGDDSSSSDDQDPRHTYDSEGTYTATLTVTDKFGVEDTDEATVTITKGKTRDFALFEILQSNFPLIFRLLSNLQALKILTNIS